MFDSLFTWMFLGQEAGAAFVPLFLLAAAVGALPIVVPAILFSVPKRRARPFMGRPLGVSVLCTSALSFFLEAQVLKFLADHRECQIVPAHTTATIGKDVLEFDEPQEFCRRRAVGSADRGEWKIARSR